MNGIIHIRIDDRLIHGQVANRWSAGATRIMVPNDKVANDEMQKNILRMAAPTGINTSIIEVETAVANILADKYASQKVLMVVNNPMDLVRMMDLGLDIKAINVGNLSKRDHTVQIKNSICINREEKNAFEILLTRGVKISAQMVPDEAGPDITNLLKKAIFE